MICPLPEHSSLIVLLAMGTEQLAPALEAAMLLCFGVSWPVSILKTLRARRVEGKSLGFLLLVFSGYAAGVCAKFAMAAHRQEPVQWVAALYALNGMMVATDAMLYLRFRPRVSPSA